jgi:hypothetical protein
MSFEAMAPLPPPPPPLPRMTIDVYTKESASPTVQREDAQLARFVSAVRGALHAHVEQLWASAPRATVAHFEMLSAEDAKRWAFQVGENKRSKSIEAYAMWRQLALLRAGRASISLGRDLMSSIKIHARCAELRSAALTHTGAVKQHSLLPQRLVREAQQAKEFARTRFDHACETHRVMAARALRPLSRRPAMRPQRHEQALAQLRSAATVSYSISDASDELDDISLDGGGGGGGAIGVRPASGRAHSTGECSVIYRYMLRESCSQFDSLPLTYLLCVTSC